MGMQGRGGEVSSCPRRQWKFGGIKRCLKRLKEMEVKVSTKKCDPGKYQGEGLPRLEKKPRSKDSFKGGKASLYRENIGRRVFPLQT